MFISDRCCLADRQVVRRGPLYTQWSPDRPHYEHRGVPFHGRGGMGYQSSRGGWFARRGPGLEMDRGPRRRLTAGSRSRSRSQSRSTRSRSKSRARTSSRSRSVETTARSRKRDVSVRSFHSFIHSFTRSLGV